MSSTKIFRFGVLNDKYSVQCKQNGYTLKNAEKWDKIVDCIIMLYIHNILTESRYDEYLDRLLKFSKEDITKDEN